MTTPAKDVLVLVNPNRPTFVLMVTFLSIVNSLAALLRAADQQEFLAAYALNFFYAH